MATTDTADLNAIVKDVADLKKDLGKLMDHVRRTATDTVSDETHRVYSALVSEGERSATALAQRIEEKPFASMMIAFALGFVGGNILRR